MVYCAATGSQYQVYMKLCLLIAGRIAGHKTNEVIRRDVGEAVDSQGGERRQGF